MHSSLRASKNVFIRLFYSMQTRLDVLGLKLYVLSCWVEEINLIFIVQNYKQRPRNTFEFIVPPSFSNIIEKKSSLKREKWKQSSSCILSSPFSQVKARWQLLKKKGSRFFWSWKAWGLINLFNTSLGNLIALVLN